MAQFLPCLEAEDLLVVGTQLGQTCQEFLFLAATQDNGLGRLLRRCTQTEHFGVEATPAVGGATTARHDIASNAVQPQQG